MVPRIYLLGGYQTDFARHWTREGLELADLCGEAVRGALEETDLSPGEIDCGHVGNFIGELLCGQGHLGGLFIEADPAFAAVRDRIDGLVCADRLAGRAAQQVDEFVRGVVRPILKREAAALGIDTSLNV